MDNYKTLSIQLLIFRTDIKTRKKAKMIKPLFDHHRLINSWSVDTEDIDNVLRIEARNGIGENDIIYLLKTCGFHCEPLED
ncbi:hypothetical protein FNH22_04750 [Fulvivirga sp. M361]|uniref:hypothetical protein n=1 Tax=Fulvivirga sp. M361 TaxID=2594266 RepID=UPI00117AAED5|nr:hypothetical protein [Fulvivirga sp. M361]TRX61369.1 hypothetical protein FNH22_04750 [Fulvivirga sp. M361]